MLFEQNGLVVQLHLGRWHERAWPGKDFAVMNYTLGLVTVALIAADARDASPSPPTAAPALRGRGWRCPGPRRRRDGQGRATTASNPRRPQLGCLREQRRCFPR